MVWAWQRWLSPRPKQRTKTNAKSAFPYLGDAVLYEPYTRSDGHSLIRETHDIKDPLVKAGLSGPPLHIHRYQNEFFKVEQGVLGAVTDGVEHAVTKEDGILSIPAGTRHRFWCHESAQENLIFTIWLDPVNDSSFIVDINALRNSTSYLDDCKKAGLEPSPFQLILFSEHASTLVCPPFMNWMPTWLLVGVHRVLAWIGETVLGYERSYPEYTVES